MAIFEPHIFDVMSGNQRHVEATLKLFDRAVAEPVLLTPRQTVYGDGLAALGIRVAVLPAHGMLNKFGSDISGPALAGKLKIALALLAYWPSVFFWLWRNRITVVECNSTRAVLMAGPPAKLLGLPLVFYVKGHLETPLPDRIALKLADRVLFHGPRIRDRAYPELMAQIAHKVQILPNGIDLSEVEAVLTDPAAQEALRTEIGAGRDATNFATAGQIAERRGQDRLIRAVSELQQRGVACRLFIVGDYVTDEFLPYYNHCRALVEELGVRDVFFMGYRRDAVAIMSVMDITVLPSRDEGVPKTILEGMALGKAVIVTDVGSVRDAVSEQEGLIIPAGQPQALVDAMENLARDPAQRKILGEAGRRRALAEFDIVRNIHGLEEIIKNLDP